MAKPLIFKAECRSKCCDFLLKQCFHYFSFIALNAVLGRDCLCVVANGRRCSSKLGTDSVICPPDWHCCGEENPGQSWVQYRFSAFWLRSKCSICSYQLNIWYVPHRGTSILNWFLDFRRWFTGLLGLLQGLAWYCSTSRIGPLPREFIWKPKRICT